MLAESAAWSLGTRAFLAFRRALEGVQEVPNNDSVLVGQYLEHLRALLGQDRYSVWCEGRIRAEWADGELRLGMVNQFVCEHIRRTFHDVVAEACRSTFGEPKAIHYSVVSDANIAQPVAPLPVGKPGVRTPKRRQIAPPVQVAVAPDRPNGVRRRFALLEEFEAGIENQLPLTMCRLLVEHPDRYHSLVLCGGPSSGKTHLLEGIWRAHKSRNAGVRMALFTAEDFTAQFVTAHREGGLPLFCSKLRGLDVLLVDDVHELGDRPACREELQQSVEHLVRGGRQVVLTSASPLTELGWITHQFASRLQGGQICKLASAEASTRLKLCRRFAIREELKAADEALQWIADRWQGDVRSLCGAMLRLRALQMTGVSLLTKEIVAEVFQEELCQAPAQKNLDRIAAAVCEVMGVKEDQLKSSDKCLRVTTARMLGMFLARKYSSRSLAEIGLFFGGRVHSTVSSAQAKVLAWLHSQKLLPCSDVRRPATDVIDRIEARLRALG